VVLGCSKSCIISTYTLQKEDKEEAGAARGDGVAVRQEDVVHHEAGVVAEEASEVIVAEEALEVIVVAEALGAAEAQEGSAVVVAVAEDLGEVVVVTEDHDIVFMYVKHKLQTSLNGLRLVGSGERTWSDHLKIATLSVHRLLRRLEIVQVAISHGGSSRPWFTCYRPLPSKDRIVTEYSFLSVDHVMTQIEDKRASIVSN